MAILTALAVYSCSALVSLQRLVSAARVADGAEIIARTNVPRVRRAIVDQLVMAYLDKIGQKRPVKPLERMAIQAIGTSIADDLAIKLITPANLSAVLRSGAIRDDASRIEFTGMPALANLDTGNLLDMIGRVYLIKPVEFELSLGTGDATGSISMHFENFGWKLSGIRLPPAVVANLVQRLPAR